MAIPDALNAARRQLESYTRRLRREIKTHEPPALGRVVELVPAEDFGRIETPDGRLVCFHRHSVLGAELHNLEESDEVRFAEELGEQGPQASTVHVIGKH